MPSYAAHPYFVQALGFAAFAFGVASFLSRDDRRLKILLAAQCLMLAAHFTLLGAQGGAAMAFLGMVRNLLSASGRNLRPFAWAFIAVYLGAGILRYEAWVDALPVTASVIGTYAVFRLDGIRMRTGFLAGGSLWLAHNILVGSIGPALMEAVMICATLRTMHSLHQRPVETTP